MHSICAKTKALILLQLLQCQEINIIKIEAGLNDQHFAIRSSLLSELVLKVLFFAFNHARWKKIMHQSIETTAPQAPGHSGEFNIYPVLKDGLFSRPRGQ